MNSRHYSSQEAHEVVTRYHEDPTPENGEVVLTIFTNLTGAYVRFLKYGQPSRAVRRLQRMCQEWLPVSMQSYDIEDLEHEIRILILECARTKGCVVAPLPYHVMSLIRQLTSSPTVRNCNLGEADHEKAEDAPVVDDSVHTLIDTLVDLDERERFLLHRVVEGHPHHQIRLHVAERYDEEPLSRRRTSELIHEVGVKVAQSLGIDISAFTDVPVEE